MAPRQNTSELIKTDLLVIGAGSGGLSVAAGAVQMGASVVLLEGGEMGGDCLNYGCVPSKALLSAAKRAHGVPGSRFGVTAEAPQIDYAAAMDHVTQAIETIAPVDSQERFEGLGVRVIRAFGKFVSATEVEAGAYRIKARRVVIATGAAPLVPPIPGLTETAFLTNETLWQLRSCPEHLLIIGGGPIGLEMAQAHRRLGAEVTVVEGAQALGREDPEAAALVLDALRAEGVQVIEGASVTKVSGPRLDGVGSSDTTASGSAAFTQAEAGATATDTADTAAPGEAGAVKLTLSDGQTLSGSHLLVAVGRKPNIAGLGLEAAGIEGTPQGIQVDSALKTSNRRVYAIGDVAGQGQFTHLAGYHAGVVVRSALFGLPSKASTAHIPRATYTQPELAQVGLTEAEAQKAYGPALDIARFDLTHNDRAIAEGETRGFIKVMVHKGRPVGATIVGSQAGEQIALWSMVLANRLKMSAVSAMVAPYPTLAEVNKRAASAYFIPKLFENPTVKRVVGLIQRWLP